MNELCNGSECPIRHNCKRAVLSDLPLRDGSEVEIPAAYLGGGCDNYLPIENMQILC